MTDSPPEFDPYSATFFEDPWDLYRRLRDEAPVYHHRQLGFFALSRYDDCVAAHRDHATFASTRGVTLDQLRSAAFGSAVRHVGSIIMMDPPEHDRMRALVNRAFTPRRIAEWEPVVRRVVAERLDELGGAEAFDVVDDLAGPVPIEIVSEILGVPASDRQQIRGWADAMLAREIGNPFPPAAGIEAAAALFGYVAEFVADRRRTPGDAMVDHLLAAQVERPGGAVERLDDAEVTQFVALLAAAGAETVTKLVANAVITFDEHPDQLAVVRADPSLWPDAVEEVLRWRAPSQYQGRFTLADATFHGRTIPAGSPVLLLTGAATRDPRAYVDPDRFDVRRRGPMPISFGHGVHYCIGAHLARLEGRVALEELYGRFPRLAVERGGIRFVHMSNVAGPSSVPVTC
ncbi:MAG TPA: cytochrome P450 [Microthrixaceae bacterium]|nr:cytochrome P450 [Microthrixaceae bacterium]HMT62904.1 cytochrome P450 [Microthrixaceae bacterium]